MENIEGQLDWSVSAANMTNFSCTLELFLEVTPAAELAWKTKCWMAIKAAADKIKQAQDATQRQAKFQSTMVASPVQGRNPDINLIIMRNEIKKMCISTMTDQHFDNFSAIDRVSLQAESAPDDSGTKPPTMQISQINVDKAWKHGPFVRFFEQAFEWDQMTWLTYPYFWGRKSEWLTKIEYQDEDPQFEKFMQAGYARANVPVRPGFEGALEHYLATGRIWEGGPLPGMTSPTFLPLAMEIQESLGKKAQEPTKYGDPWIVKVPTNLVRLRKDDKMPEWSKESGEWKLKPDS